MAIKIYEEDGKKMYEVYVNGFDSSGRRVQRRKRGIETLRRAEVTEFDFKRELAKLKEEAVPFHWDEWFNECLKRMKTTSRPSTVIGYEKQINKSITPHWKGIELSKITRLEVHTTLFEKLGPRISLNSRRWILNMVRRIFQMAVDDGLLIRNPTLGIQIKVPEVEQKVLTTAEVGILLREAKLNSHRFYPIWAMALMTGMRSGELFALQWKDIDLDGKMISVNKQWTNKCGYGPTKSQKNRIVPISGELLKFLQKLKLERGATSKFVLPQLKEWEGGEQARILREFCDAIGITSIKFHDLRATFITSLLARGESLARVMSMVGHSQLKTTNVYLRKAGVDVQGGTEKLGYALPDDAEAKILSIVRK